MDIRAGFLGINFIPLPFVLGHNNLNPELYFGEATLDGKAVFRKFSLPYEKIESFSINKNYLIIKVRGSIFTKIWKFGNQEDIREVKRILILKGVLNI